jgi:hypothetical protein
MRNWQFAALKITDFRVLAEVDPHDLEAEDFADGRDQRRIVNTGRAFDQNRQRHLKGAGNTM